MPTITSVEESWITRYIPHHPDAQDLTPLLVRILFGATEHPLFLVIHVLKIIVQCSKRAASSIVHEKRQAVRMKLDKVFQATVDIGIGETVTAAAGQPSLHKFTLGRLSQKAFSWRQNRVPLHVFGTHAITSPVVVETTPVQEGCNTEVVKAATEVSSPSTQVNTALWRTSSHGRRLCCKLPRDVRMTPILHSCQLLLPPMIWRWARVVLERRQIFNRRSRVCPQRSWACQSCQGLS